MNGEATRSPHPTTAPMFREMTLPTHSGHPPGLIGRLKAVARVDGHRKASRFGKRRVDKLGDSSNVTSVIVSDTPSAIVLIEARATTHDVLLPGGF